MKRNLFHSLSQPMRTTLSESRARMAKLWSAVTRHRFGRRADSPARQNRVQRFGFLMTHPPCDGDKSPAQSGENSPHSIALGSRRPRLLETLGLLALLMLAGAMNLRADGTNFNSGSDGHLGALNVTANTTLDMPPNGIFHYTIITVSPGATLTFNRNPLNTPVYLLASGDVTIAGDITVNGGGPSGRTPGAGGPGGFDGGWGGYGGTGLGGTGVASDGQGPGGGKGGDYASRQYWNGSYGSVYGNSLIVPLVGGSGGGGMSGSPGAGGGGGGGAILIASNTRILVNGYVTSTGGRAACCDQVGGNGSGGAVRLVAPLVTGAGNLDTSGNGRVRVDCLDGYSAKSLHASATVSTRGSQMFVFPPYTNRLDIIEAAGQVIPEGTTNGVTISLAVGANPTNNVVIQARGFTNDVPIRLVVIPNDRASFSYDVTLAVTNNPSRLTVPVVLPIDSTSRLQVWTR